VSRSWHHGNSTQAADVGCQIRGASASRDFVHSPERTPIAVQLGRNCLIALRARKGKRLRRYWTTARQTCSLKSQCTAGPVRRIARWEHEHLLEAAKQRFDANPEVMRQRRETVEHPFGTMKARMGATHFLTKNAPESSRRDGTLGPGL
jgi:hypothetical protein